MKSPPAAPRVTVLAAFHNEARFLTEAIDSILAQTYPDFTLLAVDDGSTDRSRAIVERYDDPRIQLLVNPAQLGLAASLNRGLALVRSEYVARFDGNDVCFPGRLAAQIAWMDAHPEIAVLGTQATFIDAAGRPLPSARARRPTTAAGLRWWHIFDNPLIHQATLYRTAVIRDELGGYDETAGLGEDSDLWRRAAERFALANLPEPFVAVRIDRESTFARRRDDLRLAYAEHMLPIVHARIQQVLQWPDAPLEWTRWWIAANHDSELLPPAAVRGLIDAIEGWASRFAAIDQAAADDRDVRHHRATMLARLVRHAAAHAPIAAARAWLKTAGLDGPVARETLPKLVALGAGGRRMIHLHRWLRSS